MSLGLHEDRRQRRRRARLALAKSTVAVAIVAVAGLYAYESGSSLAGSEVADLKRQIAERDATIAGLQRRDAEQRSAIAAERARAEEWRERYRRDVPDGDRRALLDLVDARLAAGISADRLRFVVGAADEARDCDAEPVVRRFIVRTPISAPGGANDSVGFGNGAVTITAEGRSAADASGNPEAWFDAGAPITLRAALIDGSETKVTGVLPLHHAVVHGGREHRFAVTAGATGFVNVAGDTCAYP